MNHEDIVAKLTKWMTDFVEVPNPKLGDWAPCPYARQARVNNKIEIVYSSHDILPATVEKMLPILEQKDVVIIYFDHKMISPDALTELVTVYNKNFLIPRNYVVLEDHPNIPEYINGVCMNFGECGLLVLQKLDKLNNASDILREKDYYKNWTQEDLDTVVTWRYK